MESCDYWLERDRCGRCSRSVGILPGAVTRMSEGRDTSSFPPMDPELVAPLVTWLSHESCSISGEMLVSMAGRVASALVAETPGVYQPSWTIEQVAEKIDVVRAFDLSTGAQRLL